MKSWKELGQKYDMDREDMTRECELAFVFDCFDLYENVDGFAKTFWSPFEMMDVNIRANDYIGKPFKVIRRLTTEDVNLECLPMWRIRFENGNEFNAYPEEIIEREQKDNGRE